MMTVAFVSCVKTKAEHPLPAKDLYISPWFRMAREYATRNADRWFILSAMHGLLDPKVVIEPYEWTLKDQVAAARKDWAHTVKRQMEQKRLAGEKAIVLAGVEYREFLMSTLRGRFEKVAVPMEGMMMGQQLSWLKRSVA